MFFLVYVQVYKREPACLPHAGFIRHISSQWYHKLLDFLDLAISNSLKANPPHKKTLKQEWLKPYCSKQDYWKTKNFCVTVI